MVIGEAMRAGMDFMSAANAPLSLVLDLIAIRQIMQDDYQRELTGDDAEEDFLRVMRAR